MRADREEPLSEERLRTAIERFVRWLDRHGLESYDPYDIWGTRYGVLARRLYYAKSVWGAPLVAPLVAAEALVPGIRKLFVRKERFATAEAQLLQGFLNVYACTGDSAYLRKAETAATGLLQLSISGYSGHCWGYPFDWQNSRGLWKGNTPFITSTPYCCEAFLGLADATGSQEHLDVAASIAKFVAHDLRDSPVSPDASAGSYSPNDRTQVINASAYRAFVLFEAWQRFQIDEYREIAQRNLKFILESQREDGSWLYALGSPAEAFIDHFHTCFVIKNLQKINWVAESSQVVRAIEMGWDFYRHALFHDDETPKNFAIEPRTQLARVEMYNLAEAITLGTVLKDTIPGAFDLAQRLTRRAIRDYQLRDGHFVTRVYRTGLRHTMPFLRWPQAQMFLALTNALRALQTHRGWLTGILRHCGEGAVGQSYSSDMLPTFPHVTI
jgi:mannose/cellobiose epimerase-like protein (N-acyl-D-glucosamine 2-epimerase family)